ncbi:GIN domain-containing protein [Catalinimonas niigatensis]|uniref:GIN domain-containing protein n=1 Tax=Catalinimonas niigatensis TaxID=1397264 RepID=UPI002665B57F|nr:DUF2807 domain-containing protein [Catalinimonas niigatensis]WPP50384.1 DUF2807 domain-containing protein [Catalinimonas niigatensis]
MKSIFFKLSSIGIMCFAVILTSCSQEDEPITRLESNLPFFNKINVAQNITVKIRNGAQRVEITGDGNLEDVVVQVANDGLNVYNRDPSQESNVVANIWLDNLEQLICRENSLTRFPENFTSSSNVLTILGRNTASIRMEQLITIDSLYFGLRDASHMAVADLQSGEVVGDLRNTTRCNMEGFATNLNLVMTDDSKFNLDFPDASLPLSVPIQAENYFVTARNGAAAWVYPINLLNAEISDGSIIYYKGIPSSIERDLSNGGQLLSKEE